MNHEMLRSHVDKLQLLTTIVPVNALLLETLPNAPWFPKCEHKFTVALKLFIITCGGCMGGRPGIEMHHMLAGTLENSVALCLWVQIKKCVCATFLHGGFALAH